MFSRIKACQLHFRGCLGEYKLETQLHLHLSALIQVQAQIIYTVPTVQGAHFCYIHLLYSFTKYLHEMFEVSDHM